MSRFFYPPMSGRASVGLLVLRLVGGSALMFHGWPKIQNPLHWMGDAPVPSYLQLAAAVAEFGGGLALILGFLTALAGLGIAIQMGFALAMGPLPKGDPFVASKPGGGALEPAALYLAIGLLFLF